MILKYGFPPKEREGRKEGMIVEEVKASVFDSRLEASDFNRSHGYGYLRLSKGYNTIPQKRMGKGNMLY